MSGREKPIKSLNPLYTLVSVIIPCFNRINTISRAIESVQNQSITQWELVVVDDCSADDSVSIVNEYAKHDHRIKVHQMKENGGAAHARNAGIHLATYDTVALLDSDDFYHPEFLKLSLEAFNSKPANTAFVYCGVAAPEDYVPGQPATRVNTWSIPSRYLQETNPYLFELRFGTGVGIMIEKEEFIKAGQFDTRLKAAEDTDFFIRMAYTKVGHPVDYILIYIDKQLTDRLTRDYVKNAEAYRMIIHKNKDTIEDNRQLVRRWYYKYLWLNFYAGKKREALTIVHYLAFKKRLFELKLLLLTAAGLLFSASFFRFLHRKFAQ